jgi:DNA helicase-2/ATP-dependent DNA helicase PcrA
VAISCVYCGGSHADAADVRACWQRSQAGDQQPQLEGIVNTPAGVAGRGAPALARNAIVRPGQAAPDGWQGARRVPIDAQHLADPEPLAIELRQLASTSTPVLFEIESVVAYELGAPQSSAIAPHTLGARFGFHRAALHHLMVSNSIDATGASPRWHVLDQAIARGATAVVDGAGDITLADGSRAWLDGGPIRYRAAIDGVAVIHRIAIEHGALRPFADNETTADLAPDQLAAVTHQGGAARIIAPAGSGKTRVLTERARHLLQRWNLPPTAVCLVAFNKRAQQEMVQRTHDLRGLQVRTLNAIALAIVNGSAPFATRPRQLATIDEGEVRRIIGRLVKFPRKRNADPVATWIEALSLARLGLKSPSAVEQFYEGEVEGFVDVLPRYRLELQRAGVLDFDEQIQLAIEILLSDPAARAAAERACRVLLVDEFQDLTPAHLLLVRLLAGPDAAVFGVGDDDQTIYGYNGADPSWLIDFAQLFPGAGEHPLEVNYRCPSDVVAAADMLLRHNRRRVAKTIRAASQQPGLTIEPDQAPVATTLRVITDAIAAGTPAVDIAVLTRVNSLLAPVQVALIEAGIAVGGGVGREFAERTAVRSALSWLRLATATGDLAPADVAEALRRPSRPMHPNVATWVGEQSSVDGLRRLAARVNTERDAQRILEFVDDIERLQRLAASRGTASAILGALRDSMGLASSIASLDTHRRGMNRAAQNDDLTAIAQLAELHPDPATFESWLRRAVEQPWQAHGVTLATVHRVKGQEWPVVVVHHAEADQFPHRLAEDIEEERRVFHVAITRASRRLHIVPDSTPSPFILELTTEPSAASLLVTTTPSEPRVAPRVASGKAGHGLTAEQATLFEELRALRKHLASGKPAYTVFADAVLHDITVAMPSSLVELSRIKGIGPSKIEQYGAAILAAVEQATDRSGSAG